MNGKKVKTIYEYTIILHGKIKVMSESFEEIEIRQKLQQMGDVEELVIESVVKEPVGD